MSTQRRQSVYEIYSHSSRKSNPDISTKKTDVSPKQLKIRIFIGVFLTLITIILYCIAWFTPHWKEVSSKTHSLYVDGIDALIRADVLIYFNSIHRFTRQSYGLFQRCEYISNNLTKFVSGQQDIHHMNLNKQTKICTRNFIPSYQDDQFNQCHSLQYYRFCSKANEKHFNIINDYLHAAFDILFDPSKSHDISPSCDCYYPPYIKVCHVLQVFALIFLVLTSILFGMFPFMKTRYTRLKVKCFAVLSAILAMTFMLINILVMLNHFDYESAEYLKAIERHYHTSQIYKLSTDAKIALNRFLSSIQIQIGYSTIIAWVAFVLSIADGVLIMSICKITADIKETTDDDDNETIGNEFSRVSIDASMPTTSIKSDESQVTIGLLANQDFLPIPAAEIAVNESDQQSYTLTSCLKRPSSCQVHFAKNT